MPHYHQDESGNLHLVLRRTTKGRELVPLGSATPTYVPDDPPLISLPRAFTLAWRFDHPEYDDSLKALRTKREAKALGRDKPKTKSKRTSKSKPKASRGLRLKAQAEAKLQNLDPALREQVLAALRKT